MTDIEYSYVKIVESIARFLDTRFPKTKVYTNPINQGAIIPCWCVVRMPDNTTKPQVNSREIRGIGFELVYLRKLEDEKAFDYYDKALDILESDFRYLEYTDDAGNTSTIQILDRKHTINHTGLHYQFRLKVRVKEQKPTGSKFGKLRLEFTTRRKYEENCKCSQNKQR